MLADCPESFMYKQANSSIPAHLRTEHRFGGSFPTRLPPLRRSWTPKTPPRRSLPPLPPEPVPLYTLLCPPIREKHRKDASTASQAARRGRWKRMSSRAAPLEESEDEDESMPLPDLDTQESTARYRDVGIECVEWVVYKSPPEPNLQLSRPQPIIIPPLQEKPPPPSIGYGAFAERFAQLELAGIIDGSGQWPQEDSEKEGEPDSRHSKTPGDGKERHTDTDKMDMDSHNRDAGSSALTQGGEGG